jgi:endo-1,3-1,4-beta-glycanase ExoK
MLSGRAGGLAADAAWRGACLGWRYARQGAAVVGLGLGLAFGVASVLAPTALMAGAGLAAFAARDARHAEAERAFERLRAIQPGQAGEGVNFIDRFRWLDVERWVFSDGWDNGSFAANDWRADRLRVTPEGLSIVLSANPDPAARKAFSSGELQSRETFLYGYFEARMRVPRGDGLVVGLFTYTQPQGRSSWEEIDIEILGRNTRVMELTHHLHGRSRQTPIDLGFDAADDFHTYAFEWTADALRFYVDNRLVHEVRGARVQEMRRPQRFYLQLWNSIELHRWVGHIDPSEAPWVLTVSCIAQAAEYRGVSLCAP